MSKIKAPLFLSLLFIFASYQALAEMKVNSQSILLEIGLYILILFTYAIVLATISNVIFKLFKGKSKTTISGMIISSILAMIIYFIVMLNSDWMLENGLFEDIENRVSISAGSFKFYLSFLIGMIGNVVGFMLTPYKEN